MAPKKYERRRIGTILIEDGLITQEQLDQALDMQKTMPNPVGEILVSQGFINSNQLASALGRQLKIPYIPLSKYSHNPEVVKWIGRNFCEKYLVAPFDGDEKFLYISVSNPLDRNPIDTLQSLLKKKIFMFIATPDEIRKMIEQIYSKA